MADAQPAKGLAAALGVTTQQQQVLTTLVDEWEGMTVEERKRMLAAIFDSVTASAAGGGPAGALRGLAPLHRRGHP